MGTDFTFENHGSLFICRANNDAAFKHLRDHVEPLAQWWAQGVAVEPRYVADLQSSLESAGYTVEG